MPLNVHHRFHVETLRQKAQDLDPESEIKRVTTAANRMLDGTDDWPNPRLEPYEIHDYIEKLDNRDYWTRELADRG